MDRQQRPRSRKAARAGSNWDRRRTLLAGAGIGLALLLAGFLAVAGGAFGGGDGDGAAPSQRVSMAPAHAAGIEVAEPWADQGDVPLNTPVQQRYTLRNTSSQVVTLGKPSIEVLEGC